MEFMFPISCCIIQQTQSINMSNQYFQQTNQYIQPTIKYIQDSFNIFGKPFNIVCKIIEYFYEYFPERHAI